jgi:spore maturation protein CgeB
MRILLAGSLFKGSTTLDRAEGLQQLGHQIIPFDTSQVVGSLNRVERTLMGRFNSGEAISRLNILLLDMAKNASFDIFAVEKGVWILPETVRALRRMSKKNLAVHWTPDAQLVDNRSRHFIASIPEYDVLVTTKPFEMTHYKAEGAKDIMLILQGYGERFARVGLLDTAKDKDVVFIGHSQPHYRRCIQALVDADVPTQVWGPRWQRGTMFRPKLRKVIQSAGLWGDSYPEMLKRSKIALGLLGKHIPETTTTRSFEIPATGTFMLAERTDDHLALFEDNKEAVFFSNAEELCDKARFYLAHDMQREEIARAGQQRSQRSGYHVNEQMRKVMHHLEKNYRVA